MNIEEIETFLAVIEYGNVLRAAEHLYIGNGTASTRIMNLEKKLGVTLLERQKGVRKTALTPEGKLFLPIAQQWVALWSDAQKLKELQSYEEMRISASDLISSFVFEEVYKNFIKKYPDIFLTLQTEHSTEIHQQIETQKMDLGFVFVLHDYPNVISVPLYEEEMVLVFNKESRFARTKEKADLHAEHEVYAFWSEAFTLWHNYYFPYAGRKKIIVGTAAMMFNFLESEEDWTILPVSIAQDFINRNPMLTYTSISSPPPKRTAYVLTHKFPKPRTRKNAKLFMGEVRKYIKENTSLALLDGN